MPEPNAFDDYVSAGELAKAAGGSKDASQEGADEKTQRAVVTACGPALARLRQGFEKEFRNPSVRSFATLLPQLARFRDLARLLVIEGSLAEREGRLADAADSYLDALRLGDDISRGGPLLNRIVGIAVEDLAVPALSCLLPRLDCGTAERVLSCLLDLANRAVPYAETVEEQLRACCVAALEKADEPEVFARVFGDEPGVLAALTPAQLPLPEVEDYFQAAIVEARKPLYARQPVASPQDPLASVLTAPTARGGQLVALAQTRRSLLLTATALQIHCLRHGRYPARLDELVPSLLPHVPEDPLHPGALGYSATGDEYSLYGFGPDGDDDRGRAMDPAQAGEPDVEGDVTL